MIPVVLTAGRNGNKVIVEVVDKFVRDDIFEALKLYKVRIDNYAL